MTKKPKAAKVVRAWAITIDGRFELRPLYRTKAEAIASADWTETAYKYKLVRVTITLA